MLIHIQWDAIWPTQEWGPLLEGSCPRAAPPTVSCKLAAPRTARSRAAPHSPSPALPTASGTLAAGCLDPHPVGRAQAHSRVGPFKLPASPGTALRRAALHSPRARALPRLRQAALLPPAVMICILRAAGRSNQEWDPCQPLRARPGGELLCTPRAPLRRSGGSALARRAALLPQAVIINIRQAAGRST